MRNMYHFSTCQDSSTHQPLWWQITSRSVIQLSTGSAFRSNPLLVFWSDTSLAFWSDPLTTVGPGGRLWHHRYDGVRGTFMVRYEWTVYRGILRFCHCRSWRFQQFPIQNPPSKGSQKLMVGGPKRKPEQVQNTCYAGKTGPPHVKSVVCLLTPNIFAKMVLNIKPLN